MTPTADLMKLVEKWRESAGSRVADEDFDPYEPSDRQNRAFHQCADELAAALSAMGEARVGGDVGFGKLAECPPEMEEPPMTAEERTALIKKYTAKITDAEAALATPTQPKASECQRCRDWTVTMGVGGGSGKLFVHGTYDAIKACQRQLLHPKASEGEAGGPFTVECRGDSWTIYHGRTSDEHGWNLGTLTECTPTLARRIQAALNATLTAPGADDVR